MVTHNTSSLNLWLMLNSSYTLMCTHLFQILLCMILNSCWLASRFIPIYLSSHIYRFMTYINSSLNSSRSISILRMALMRISAWLLTHSKSVLFIVYFWCNQLIAAHSHAMYIVSYSSLFILTHTDSYWLLLLTNIYSNLCFSRVCVAIASTILWSHDESQQK